MELPRLSGGCLPHAFWRHVTGLWIFTAVWTVLNGIRDALPVLLAALLHEGGHYLVCRLLRVPVRFFRPAVTGAVIGYDGSLLSYGREIAVAAAGPLLNLLTAGLVLGCRGRFFALLGVSSLGLALFNLVPHRRLDGGGILHALLCMIWGAEPAARVTEVLSFCGTVFLWMCASLVQLRCGGNLSLFFISLYLLLSL